MLKQEGKAMWLKCITCEALARPVYLCAARSPHIVDVELLQRGLHNQPADLRTRLQALIDVAQSRSYDAVLLAYGLCGQATAGLIARNVPLVIPRAHDCITLFLGSRLRYRDQFENYPGTYWYSQDYIEREVRDQLAEVTRRLRVYRGTADPPNIQGRSVILVDDGVATGYTTRAAALALRNLKAASVTLAVPVGPPDSLETIRPYVDEIVCPKTPYPFLAVGYWYRSFEQVSDEEVVALLRAARAK